MTSTKPAGRRKAVKKFGSEQEPQGVRLYPVLQYCPRRARSYCVSACLSLAVFVPGGDSQALIWVATGGETVEGPVLSTSVHHACS